VIGLGFRGMHQITAEGRHALQKAKRRFILHFDPLVISALEAEFGDVDTLDDMYEFGVNRRITYRRMAERVMGAVSPDGPICLGLYGHPLFFVAPTAIMMQEGRKRGLDVAVQPGISALDCILIDVGTDPANQGLQQYEATDMLLRERPLQPDVPCVIWQIGTVGFAGFRGFGPIPAESYSVLVDYLLKFYPSSHEVKIVRTATTPLAKSRVITTTVEEIGLQAEWITSADTLYIGAVTQRPVTNLEFLAELKSTVAEEVPEEMPRLTPSIPQGSRNDVPR
jgi:tetrapyrrole methylase family protein / MazG family protein